MTAMEKCPTCGGRWELERSVNYRALLLGSELPPDSQVVLCENGHEFPLSCPVVDVPQVRLPELVRRSSLVVRRTDRACVGRCRQPIQPGQAYAATADGPLHMGC